MAKSKSKSKRQKTHHPTTNSTSALSHKEIWDDSALVRSWNDALAEYEYYHSIHARGEDVDEVLRQAELDDGANRPRDGAEGHMEMEMERESADDGEIDDDVDVTTRQGVGESVPDADADADAGRDVVRMIGPPLPLSDAAHAETDVTAPDSALAPGPTSALAQSSVSASRPTPTTATGTATGTSADQTLENIKMAYYWAGYYSGLHDGQRQQQVQTQTQHESGQGG